MYHSPGVLQQRPLPLEECIYLVNSLPRGEINVCAYRIGQAECFQQDIEAGKIDSL